MIIRGRESVVTVCANVRLETGNSNALARALRNESATRGYGSTMAAARVRACRRPVVW